MPLAKLFDRLKPQAAPYFHRLRQACEPPVQSEKGSACSLSVELLITHVFEHCLAISKC